jgi:hypothetical protein
VARRLRLKVFVVSNGSRPIRPPGTCNVSMVLVSDCADALTTGSRSTSPLSTYASPPTCRWHHAASRRAPASSL